MIEFDSMEVIDDIHDELNKLLFTDISNFYYDLDVLKKGESSESVNTNLFLIFSSDANLYYPDDEPGNWGHDMKGNFHGLFFKKIYKILTKQKKLLGNTRKFIFNTNPINDNYSFTFYEKLRIITYTNFLCFILNPTKPLSIEQLFSLFDFIKDKSFYELYEIILKLAKTHYKGDLSLLSSDATTKIQLFIKFVHEYRWKELYDDILEEMTSETKPELKTKYLILQEIPKNINKLEEMYKTLDETIRYIDKSGVDVGFRRKRQTRKQKKKQKQKRTQKRR